MSDGRKPQQSAPGAANLQKTPVLVTIHACVLHARARNWQCNLPQHSSDVLASGHWIRGPKVLKHLVVGSCRFLPMCTHRVQVFHTQAVLPRHQCCNLQPHNRCVSRASNPLDLQHVYSLRHLPTLWDWLILSSIPKIPNGSGLVECNLRGAKRCI